MVRKKEKKKSKEIYRDSERLGQGQTAYRGLSHAVVDQQSMTASLICFGGWLNNTAKKRRGMTTEQLKMSQRVANSSMTHTRERETQKRQRDSRKRSRKRCGWVVDMHCTACSVNKLPATQIVNGLIGSEVGLQSTKQQIRTIQGTTCLTHTAQRVQ